MLIFCKKIYPHGIFNSKRILFFLAIPLLYILLSVFSVEYLAFLFSEIKTLSESISLISILNLILICALILLVYNPLCEIMTRKRFFESIQTNFSKEDFYKYFRLHHNIMVRVSCIQLFQEITQYISLGVSKCLETNNEHDVLLRSGLMQIVSSNTIFNKTG